MSGLNVVQDLPCFSCREPCHCCTESYPDENLLMITLHDAQRVAAATGKKIEEFAEFRRVKPERWGDLEEDEKYYLIDDSALFLKKKGNKCVFLDDEYKCVVHRYRPNLCRMYPFWYDGEGGDIRIVRMNPRDSDECPITKDEPRVSGRVFKKLLETREGLLTVARRYDEELEIYQNYKKDFLKLSPSQVLLRFRRGLYG